MSEDCLTNGGIIILDDYFHCHWPGVSEGTLSYFLTTNTKLIPFALSPNKTYFTNTQEFSKKYHDYLTKNFSNKIIKHTKFLDNEIVIIE